MKKSILLAFTAVFVLGLVAAVYALNQTYSGHRTMTADCCKKSESCPMKNKTGGTQAAAEKAGCCDMDGCCCNNGSCPMKGSAAAENGACCEMDNCCCKNGSCPMKKQAEKETAAVDLTNVTVAADGENCCQTGADCCSGGACCKGKHG